jgi:hypothetical protein
MDDSTLRKRRNLPHWTMADHPNEPELGATIEEYHALILNID